jgi:hypothetical protein
VENSILTPPLLKLSMRLGREEMKREREERRESVQENQISQSENSQRPVLVNKSEDRRRSRFCWEREGREAGREFQTKATQQ